MLPFIYAYRDTINNFYAFCDMFYVAPIQIQNEDAIQ